MRYNFGFDESNKMSTKEFRSYLIKANLNANLNTNSDFVVSNKDLYRAKWSIRKYVREYEWHRGKRVSGYAYIEALDVWKVFV